MTITELAIKRPTLIVVIFSILGVLGLFSYNQLKYELLPKMSIPWVTVVTVYPGANGSFVMYEDDGKTFEHRKGAWSRLTMTWNDATRRLTLTPSGSRPQARDIEIRVAGSTATKRLRFEGKPAEVTLPAS